VTTALLLLAVLLAAAALTLSWVTMRQSGRALTAVREHRRAHAHTFGAPDPEPPREERRRLNLGPPRGGDRRRAATTAGTPAQPPDGPLVADPATAEVRALPRPGQIGTAR
jgi:hypothetical protein